MNNELQGKRKLLGIWDAYSFGQGEENIIYLHDALGSVDSWGQFPSGLHQIFPHKGYVYSRLGHGYSQGEKVFEQNDYLMLEAEQLRDFIEYHQIQNPILIGSSDGGSIALLYASKYPAKAVISIAGHYKVEDITAQGVADTMTVDITDKIIYGLQRMHPTQASYLVKAWQRTWTSEEYKKWNIHSELEKINIPTLILQGEKDPYATISHATDMAQIIGDKASVFIIENTKHFPHLEAAEVVINQIEFFLKDISLCEN